MNKKELKETFEKLEISFREGEISLLELLIHTKDAIDNLEEGDETE